MYLTLSQQAELITRVEEVAYIADDTFNTDIGSCVSVSFNVKGKVAGKAYWDGQIKLNPEACDKYFKEMMEEVIPHEVAHLVCFQKPFLGKGHNKRWKRVCKQLGGTGERCHSFQLTPGRKVTKYKYAIGDGTEITLGAIRHNKIQDGHLYWMNPQGTESGKREYIEACHFVGKV